MPTQTAYMREYRKTDKWKKYHKEHMKKWKDKENSMHSLWRIKSRRTSSRLQKSIQGSMVVQETS